VITCAIWLLVAFLARYSSLAALVAFLVAPIAGLIFGGRDLCLLALAITCFIYAKHRGNIDRLRAGIEPRIGKS
jgi:glycerol-3-phosphate acyltransferase PlsY